MEAASPHQIDRAVMRTYYSLKWEIDNMLPQVYDQYVTADSWRKKKQAR